MRINRACRVLARDVKRVVFGESEKRVGIRRLKTLRPIVARDLKALRAPAVGREYFAPVSGCGFGKVLGKQNFAARR